MDLGEQHFWIPGRPIPKARSRISRRHGVLRSYTPRDTRLYELHVRTSWIGSKNKKRPVEPTEVLMCIYIQRPKTVTRQMPITRPDIDNYIKSVLDALNGVAWEDDAQITSLRVVKRYASIQGVRITIRRDLEL